MWINTMAAEYVAPELQRIKEAYPKEYDGGGTPADIIMAHSLIPKFMEHAFLAYAALLDPKLPLVRRQHEMIAVVVSSRNHCVY